MCKPSSLAQERENRECVLIRDANMNARGRKNMKCVLGGEENEKGQRKNG